MLDSPRFNLYLGSYCKRVLVERVTILADWEAQAALQSPYRCSPQHRRYRRGRRGHYHKRHRRVELRRRRRRQGLGIYCPTTASCPAAPEYDRLQHHGVRGAGLSMGSVHLSLLKPCVRDVVFEKATLWSPLKGPYVKPDRATPECLHLDHDCSASIQNVTYKHVRPSRCLSGEAHGRCACASPRCPYAWVLRRRRGAPWLGPVRELPPREGPRARRTLYLPADGGREAPPGDLIEENEVRRPRLPVHDVAALPRSLSSRRSPAAKDRVSGRTPSRASTWRRGVHRRQGPLRALAGGRRGRPLPAAPTRAAALSSRT